MGLMEHLSDLRCYRLLIRRLSAFLQNAVFVWRLLREERYSRKAGMHMRSAISLSMNAGNAVFSWRVVTRYKQVEQTDTGFIIRTSGMVYSSNNLVLACGGSSYPKTGSTGDGYRIAASLGHTITDIGPVLAPLIIKDFPFSSLTGMTFPEISFSVWRMNRKITEAKGDIVFTHNGLSGPGYSIIHVTSVQVTGYGFLLLVQYSGMLLFRRFLRL